MRAEKTKLPRGTWAYRRVFCASLFLLSQPILAQTTASNLNLQELRLGTATVQGSGCAGGTAETRLDEKSGELQIRLPSFSAELGQDGRPLHRATCLISIAASLPPKKRLVISRQSVQTELDLPIGSAANLHLESFFPGNSGRKLEPRIHASGTRIHGPRTFDEPTLVTSACVSSENLRVNFSVTLTPKPLAGTARVTADRIALALMLQDCP